MMVAVAWVMKTDRRYSELYPEVIMVDVTENANKEKRPMMLIVGNDSDRTTFVMMKILIPHHCVSGCSK